MGLIHIRFVHKGVHFVVLMKHSYFKSVSYSQDNSLKAKQFLEYHVYALEYFAWETI